MLINGINEVLFYIRKEDFVLLGDYGYYGDSEYSYVEYGDDLDDGW